jgi:hypothetical protein
MGMGCDPVELPVPSKLTANQTFFVLLIVINDAYLFQVDASHALSMLKYLCLGWLVLNHLVAEKFPYLDESFVFGGLFSFSRLRHHLSYKRIGLVLKLWLRF